MSAGCAMWTLLFLLFGAALQHRWRSERVRLEHSDDADREQRRAARIAAWALRLDEASQELERAVDAWHATVPPAYRGDPDTRAGVACARDRLAKLRDAAPEELHHG